MAKIILKKRKKASSASASDVLKKRPAARSRIKPGTAKAKSLARKKPAAPKIKTPAKVLVAGPGQLLAREIAQLTLNKKAFDVTVLDVRGLSTAADFFVIASGATDIQIRAIRRAIEEGLQPKGIKALHIEGEKTASWLLMDYVDVVVHIMQPRVRDYYNLEALWGDAPREEIKE
ncbi:MAG: ribosome silencing factor [Candidatus Edwardsbacteria bacterium]|nr:ribosome silencing factor [Candidatus Edwardsbacteria bacterium]